MRKESPSIFINNIWSIMSQNNNRQPVTTFPNSVSLPPRTVHVVGSNHSVVSVMAWIYLSSPHTCLDLLVSCVFPHQRTAACGIVLSLYLSKRSSPIPAWNRERGLHIKWFPIHKVFAVSTRAQTYTRRHTHSRAHTHTHSHAHTHARTHTHIHTHTYTRTRAHPHTYECTYCHGHT